MTKDLISGYMALGFERRHTVLIDYVYQKEHDELSKIGFRDIGWNSAWLCSATGDPYLWYARECVYMYVYVCWWYVCTRTCNMYVHVCIDIYVCVHSSTHTYTYTCTYYISCTCIHHTQHVYSLHQYDEVARGVIVRWVPTVLLEQRTFNICPMTPIPACPPCVVT